MMPYLAGRPSFLVDRRWNPDVDPLAPNCPRCDSPNTKFCYYNNYSLSQPRYFCKNCRRYWTKGGSLRNVPVGGGCRKSRRARSSARISNCARLGVSRECRQPVQNQSSSGSSTVDSSMEESASDGTNIDLALLYSRFLNQSANGHLAPAAEAAADHVPGDEDDDDESFELRSVIVNSDRHVQQRLPAADMFPPETQLSNIDLLPAPAGDLQGICFDVPAGPCSVPPTLLPTAEGFAYDDVFWSAGSSTCAAGLTQTWHYPLPPPPHHDQIPGMAAFQVEDHLQLHSNLYSNSWDMPWA